MGRPAMNSSPLVARNETPKLDKNVTPQGVGPAEHQLTIGPAPVTKPKPTIAQLRHALDAFNIRGTCRLVAYELLSYWKPGGQVFPLVKTIAVGLGKSERVVQRQLDRLERVGIWVRLGPAPVGRPGRHPSLYDLRLPKTLRGDTSVTPGVTPASPRSNQREVVQQPPLADKMSGPTETPALSEHLEATADGHGLRCRRCQHSWPAVTGRAHICVGQPERTERERPKRTRPGRTSDSRSARINAERLARMRAERPARDGVNDHANA